MLRTVLLAMLALAILILTGCSTATSSSTSADSGKHGTAHRLTLFATTGQIADALHNIAPAAKVVTLVGPGADPHTYQPSTKDIETLLSADLVFWNGLNLEAQMVKPLKSLGDRQLAVGDKLPKDRLLTVTAAGAHEKHYDPHIWNDPELWQQAVTLMAQKLAAYNPHNADIYTENARAYNQQIAAAAAQAGSLLAEVPEPRTLITGHDAFGYFGRSFNLEVHATDFVSTTAALGAKDIENLATLIADRRIPAIFNDSQANPQAIQSLSEAVKTKGFSVQITSAELYADTLGSTKATDTYIEVLLHNAATIAEGLER